MEMQGARDFAFKLLLLRAGFTHGIRSFVLTLSMFSITGRANAMVFPEPVRDLTTMSLPAEIASKVLI